MTVANLNRTNTIIHNTLLKSGDYKSLRNILNKKVHWLNISAKNIENQIQFFNQHYKIEDRDKLSLITKEEARSFSKKELKDRARDVGRLMQAVIIKNVKSGAIGKYIPSSKGAPTEEFYNTRGAVTIVGNTYVFTKNFDAMGKLLKATHEDFNKIINQLLSEIETGQPTGVGKGLEKTLSKYKKNDPAYRKVYNATKRTLASIDKGHLRGPAGIVAEGLNQVNNKLAFTRMGISEELKEIAQNILKIETQVSYKRKVTRAKLDGKLRVGLLLELDFLNQHAGSKVSTDMKKARNLLLNNLSKLESNVKFKKLLKGLGTLKGSESLFEMIEGVTLYSLVKELKSNQANNFLKSKGRKSSYTATTESDIWQTIEEFEPSRMREPTFAVSEATIGAEDPNLNLLVWNRSKFHDAIKDNMSTHRTKQNLMYDTGVFARKAKIESIDLPDKKNGVARAVVKYQRKPYGVFEPGGPPQLATPGRNPARIFGKSIRQLLIEDKIMQVSRVKVELRG
jgi:hypothetical protein